LQILANKALAFDHQLSEAYVVKGLYYLMNSTSDQAINEIDKAIRFNPNNWLAYYAKGRIYSFMYDHRNSIDGYYFAISLYRGPLLPEIYRHLASSFFGSGFKKIGDKYLKEALELDDDSASYYSSLAAAESNHGNFKKGIELYRRAHAIDSTELFGDLMIGNNYLFLGQLDEALKHYKKGYDKLQAQLYSEHMSAGLLMRIGESYLYNGKEETAKYYLNRARDLYDELNQLGQMVGFSEIHDIYEHSLLYAILGDKDKGLEYLSLYHKPQHVPAWLVIQLKFDPAFDSIRDEPEFQQIVRDVEAKYQAEHERVRQWLEENEML
jgi:tetratricopeptide (TPR) repeat protein